MDDQLSSFPTNGILPKKETGALSFLSKYANYDGRGVLIAIIDTGVDPAAPGLQLTSDGKPKIIDIIDATGAGNVDISIVAKPDSEGNLTGLTGRKLAVPFSWTNPSGNFYLGMKSLYELCSSQLKDRLKRERKEKLWQPYNDEALYQIQNRLNDLGNEAKIKKLKETPDSAVNSSTSGGGEAQKDAEADFNEFFNTLTKEDLQTQLELVKDLDGKVKDIGPVFDCLVWNDGATWRACIDTSEQGDLASCKVLTNFKDSHEHGTFSYVDMLNYIVRILPDEHQLQIVTDSGSHGTHVASIATGCYADKPEMNGVAPGAQIISIKVGDSRIGSMETGYALVNACRYVAEYKCDLVNYSFGEPINYAHMGPALTAVEELVSKYGVIYCASAGNEGPGVETAGAPGSIVPSVISVGAYVTPDMIKAEHSLLNGQNAAPMLFTWSARGPQRDGGHGVSVCAPGGAFAAVPNWTQRGTQLMSGTSMSSPNCCGCIALVLSGLKQRSVEYTPYGIRRSLENTAMPVDEAIGSGSGLVQVEKAFEYAVENTDSLLQKIWFDVRYIRNAQRMRGIYLKRQDEVNETRDYLITLDPVFFENTRRSYQVPDGIENDLNQLNLQKEKISFSKKVALVVEGDSNASQWVECAPHLYLVNSTRQFHVRLHPQNLEEGKFHFAQVKAYDLDDPKRVCVFKVPISVVKAKEFCETSNKKSSDFELEYKNVVFKQGQIHRSFIRAPLGATHAELVIKCNNETTSKDHAPLFMVQTFTLGCFRTQHEKAYDEVTRLNTTSELKALLKVQSNKVLQVSIAKNWSNIGHLVADYTIKFRGLLPKNASEMSMCSSYPYQIDVDSLLKREECELSISWKFHVQPLKPIDHQIEIVKPAMGMIKPIYQIVLTYTFNHIKAGDVGCEVPLLSHNLYENEYQSVYWNVHETASKMLVFSGDAFPIHYKYTASLEKGDYTVRLFVRHEKIEMLERLKELSLHVRNSITGVTQDIYTSHVGLLKGSGKKSGSRVVPRNSTVSYLFAPINDDKLPKGLAGGHFLIGELGLFKETAVNKVDNHLAYYHVNNVSTAKKESKQNNGCKSTVKVEKNDKPKKTENEKLKEAVRDAQVSYIVKINELYETLRNEYPDHIPVYLNRIQYLENQIVSANESEVEKKSSLWDDIVSTSKAAIDRINQDELLKYLGEKTNDPSLSEENKKDFDNQKGWIVDLLVQQGVALIERDSLVGRNNKSGEQQSPLGRFSAVNDELRKIFRSIQKWAEISDEKVTKFAVKFYLYNGLHGKAMKALLKQAEEKPSKQVDQSILNLLKDMRLRHAFKFQSNYLIMKHQSKFASF